MDGSRATSLSALLDRLADCRVRGPRDVRVTSLAIDSREVTPGAVFFALRGEHTDGHEYVGQALSRGAAAVVVERDVEAAPGVAVVIVNDSAQAASRFADEFYGRPSQTVRVAGVTGTNGKTTTTHMIAAMLDEGGVPCGVIGTVGAHFGQQSWPLENTTPLAPELHAVLGAMRDAGARAVAMEVSSHALALGRVSDVRFAAAGLTNITRDHLDFHKTFEAYAGAKRRLFDASPVCVLNADDDCGARWSGELRHAKRVTTYAIRAAADIHAEKVEMRGDGSTFVLDGRSFDVRLPGTFNVENALCAIGMARALGVDDTACARGLAKLDRVPGRMEHLSGDGIDVLIDYAHTPDALENVLRAARGLTAKRVLAVFGCGGDRDRGKRPLMGDIASRLADRVFVTSDNPRTEDPRTIIEDILKGIDGQTAAAIVDRAAAIRAAIADARTGDIVVIAGKGHEKYQILGTRTVPFDDLETARAALLEREKAHA